MNVPLLDLQAQYASLKAELRPAVEGVLESQRFVLGDEVRRLESSIAEYCHTKHAVGCASGSDALLLALMALDIAAGDEVVTTPFSFFATGSCIARLGARPVFVDIDPRTYNLDVSQVADAITPRTKAIVPCTSTVSAPRWIRCWHWVSVMVLRSSRMRRRRSARLSTGVAPVRWACL